MREVFGDTFYYLALISPSDEAHANALAFSEVRDIRVITTAWVLTEVADALSLPSIRLSFGHLFDCLCKDPLTHVVPATETLFEKGIDLYLSRPDKEWSLTDCISFVVMREWGLTESLTADRHFEQAGFKALLL